jgi:WD40 repeat protein
LTSDRQIVLYENKITKSMASKSHFLIDTESATAPLKTFKCDSIQSGIWYLPIHNRWITAGGADHTLRLWIMDEDGIRTYKKGNEIIKMIKHTKKVTSVIDIKNPRLIVSCGLDGNICLWDGESTSKENLIAIMEDPGSKMKRGVRSMTYSYEFGGNVLTCGFETHIKVWQPEVSTTRPF